MHRRKGKGEFHQDLLSLLGMEIESEQRHSRLPAIGLEMRLMDLT